MTIEFSAMNKPEDRIEIVAGQLATFLKDKGFTVPPSIGSNFPKQYYPFPWLTLTCIDFMAYEPRMVANLWESLTLQDSASFLSVRQKTRGSFSNHRAQCKNSQV